MLMIAGAGLVLWGLWTGLGNMPFLFVAGGIFLMILGNEDLRNRL